MRKTARQSGFTLIELLIVLGVIVLLASFVFPNVLASRAKANDLAARAYGKQLFGHVTAWVAEQPGDSTSHLLPDCTAPQYLAQGAPSSPPLGVTKCQVQQLGSARYLVRVTTVNGKVFDFNQ
ncbi:prepilin-type N-terminal cleavage/methylation domain-containing protein [Deinococcus sp. YIM 134068]|uniref:type II secretion system protein n=1 Tax=Deinococcus lichenicola TaxID=3118910 RepID=UPI002F93683F